jgi:chemotaxis methyl-accepting protein methylase
MFCPSTGETLVQITEKTKLLTHKCSNSESALRQPVASFKSYINDLDENLDTSEANINPIETNATQTHRHHHTFQCLTVNLSNLNRLIKTRCSFVSSTSTNNFNYTFPRKKKSTAKWYIKVSL